MPPPNKTVNTPVQSLATATPSSADPQSRGQVLTQAAATATAVQPAQAANSVEPPAPSNTSVIIKEQIAKPGQQDVPEALKAAHQAATGPNAAAAHSQPVAARAASTRQAAQDAFLALITGPSSDLSAAQRQQQHSALAASGAGNHTEQMQAYKLPVSKAGKDAKNDSVEPGSGESSRFLFACTAGSNSCCRHTIFHLL